MKSLTILLIVYECKERNSIKFITIILSKVAEPEPVELKLFETYRARAKIIFLINIYCSQFGGW